MLDDRTRGSLLQRVTWAKRQRVVASESESGFLTEGFTTYIKLDKALERTFGHGLGRFKHVLDWGCGCGRVTRYLDRDGGSITGADIDGESVQWCRQNLAFHLRLAV